MSFLNIEVKGQQSLEFKLNALLGPDLTRNILDDATAALFGRIRARYLAKVDPNYVPWVPSQAGQLREAGGGPGTLYDTGNLFRSIQAATGADPNERIIGTDVPYAPFVQFGYTINTKKGVSTVVPARVFLGIGDEDQTVIDAIVNSRLERALGIT